MEAKSNYQRKKTRRKKLISPCSQKTSVKEQFYKPKILPDGKLCME